MSYTLAWATGAIRMFADFMAMNPSDYTAVLPYIRHSNKFNTKKRRLSKLAPQKPPLGDSKATAMASFMKADGQY